MTGTSTRTDDPTAVRGTAAATAAEPGAYEIIRHLFELRATAPGDAPATRLGLVASRGRPKFLVPLGWSPAMLASCLAYQGLREPRVRANRAVVGNALRLAAGRRAVVRDELTMADGPSSLLTHLREVLGRDDLAVATGVGRIHELWRPTLQVFAPDGAPLAYVKVGRTPEVADLVENEAAVLRLWSAKEDPRLFVPEVIAETTWREYPILSVAPMPEDVRRLPPGPVGAWGVRTLDAPLPDAPLADAAWWTTRRQDHADTPDVDALLARIEERHGGPARSWARCHGDWVPWNIARSHAGLVVWDWEYSEPGAPVGLDEAHQAYQVAHVAGGRPVAESLDVARAAADSPWVADAHVAMLVTRYARYEQRTGRRLHDHAELLHAAARAVR